MVRKQSFNFPVQIQTVARQHRRVSDFVHQRASLISSFCINITLKRVNKPAIFPLTYDSDHTFSVLYNKTDR